MKWKWFIGLERNNTISWMELKMSTWCRLLESCRNWSKVSPQTQNYSILGFFLEQSDHFGLIQSLALELPHLHFISIKLFYSSYHPFYNLPSLMREDKLLIFHPVGLVWLCVFWPSSPFSSSQAFPVHITVSQLTSPLRPGRGSKERHGCASGGEASLSSRWQGWYET